MRSPSPFDDYQEDTRDIVEGSFMEFVASESYVSPGERAWLRWIEKAERILGRDIDGDEGDGFSLDSAYNAESNGLTPEQYVIEVRADANAWRSEPLP